MTLSSACAAGATGLPVARHHFFTKIHLESLLVRVSILCHRQLHVLLPNENYANR